MLLLAWKTRTSFLLLNLILAVIVDKAQEARNEDEAHTLKEKETQYQQVATQIAKLCEDLATDNDGLTQEEELLNGYEINSRFSSMLELMDIRREDLKALFSILDSDRSGSVSYTEFVDEMYRMKTQADHTLLAFIRHTRSVTSRKIEEQLYLLKQETAPKHGKLNDMTFHLYRALTNAGIVSEEAQRPFTIHDEGQTMPGVIKSYNCEPGPLHEGWAPSSQEGERIEI